MIKKFSILFAAIAAMFISTPVSADDVIETLPGVLRQLKQGEEAENHG